LGIDVSDTKLVSLNDRHERRVITSKEQAAQVVRFGPTLVHCVFSRTRIGDARNDGNPLIYALKGTHGYTIGIGDIRQLHRRAAWIVRKTVEPGQYDIIVPIPSSKGIPRRVAKSLRHRLGPTAVIADILRKPTIAEALASAPDPALISRRDQQAYKHALGKLRGALPSRLFAMKDVDAKARRYFTPVLVDPDARLPHGSKIIVVDDLLASGTTIICAADLCRRYFRPRRLDGLALLGPLFP
jgi:hypothetical protein